MEKKDNTNETETIRSIDEANDMVWYQRGTIDFKFDVRKLVSGAYEDSIRLNYEYGLGRCLLNMGMGAFILDHNFDQSQKHINEALEIFKKLNNHKWISNTYITSAIIQNTAGSPEEALYKAIKGIEFYKENENDSEATMAYYVLGTIYKDLKKIDEAAIYFKKGIEHLSDHSMWSARIYTGLSNVENERGNYHEALELAYKSLELLKVDNNILGQSRALTDIGSIYRRLKNYDKALECFFEGLELRRKNNVKHFVLGSLLEIATTFIEIKEYEKAISFYNEAFLIANETGHQQRLASIHQNLADLYKKTGKLSDAIEQFEKLIEVVNSIHKNEREQKLTNLQSELVKEKEQEIERLKNIELKNAYDLIHEKNKEITDSIHYAKRIQKALLASNHILENNLKEHFVLYKPKDIVSGDFYWATKIIRTSNSKTSNNSTNSELFYLAVCDSTGHGVPGAFMSLLNITFLNEAINEKNILQPNEILNYVREKLINSLSQDGGQDGMDGILICIEKGNNKITYAASNNSPILSKKGKCISLHADKMPIGKGIFESSFTNHEIILDKNDILYLITDGFADQFGGPRGKKFKHKQLEEWIEKLYPTPLQLQANELGHVFDEWKGDLEQVDDVCIIGIRI